MAFGFSTRSPARGELAYESGQRGPYQKEHVAVPGPGSYNSRTPFRNAAPAGGLVHSASERSFVSAFAARPDFHAASRTNLDFTARLAACGTPNSLAARRTILRDDHDPNWITSPTPLTKDAAEITLGMPGPGSRKGRAVTDYESAQRTFFAPTIGSTWGGSFSPMYSAGTMPPSSPIRNPLPLLSSRSSFDLGSSPSQRSLRLQALHEGRQKARTAGWNLRAHQD